MVTLEDIKKPVLKEFSLFDKEFKEALSSDNEILKLVHEYILRKTGKQIRPLLTFLSARLCGEITQDTINSAIALEMLHTASLIHDDIVDEADERRGQQSINSKWNNKISVLCGDYILSQALYIASKTRNLNIIDNIVLLGKELTNGELIQLNNAKNVSVNEENYFQVIEKKTAILFSICMQCGAISVKASKEKIDKLTEIGKIYGLIFQIKDDIFDFVSSEKEIGKPVGNDIREGKVTLPLIYAINNADTEKKEECMNILKQKDFTKENIDKLIHFAISNGGIEYAEQKMVELKEKAMDLLDSFPDSDIKTSTIQTIQHTIERRK